MMKSALYVIAALAVLGGQALAAGSDVAALHAADDAWVKAFNGGDVDGVASLYDETAVLLPPGAPPQSGRAAIRAFFAVAIPETAKAGVRFTLGPKPDGGVTGAWGWSSGTYTVADKAGKVVETGKYLSVSRKVGGKWLYVRDTWNGDGAPAPAAPEKK
jgi:ketosteroid isomerase-like protein